MIVTTPIDLLGFGRNNLALHIVVGVQIIASWFLSTLVLRHLWHAGVLARILLLLLKLLVVHLLLFWGHVPGSRRSSWHTVLWLWHLGNIIRRLSIDTVINAVFISSRLGSVEASLDEILALRFGDERL